LNVTSISIVSGTLIVKALKYQIIVEKKILILDLLMVIYIKVKTSKV